MAESEIALGSSSSCPQRCPRRSSASGRISLKRKFRSSANYHARSDGLRPDASSASAIGGVYERRLTLHPEARERPWLVIGGPALRMHTQPHAAPSGNKLTQLCWVPPVATLVEHYTGRAMTCEEVLRAAGNQTSR